MTHLITLAFAALVGAGLGYIAGRVPISPLIQSVGAALLGWIAGSATRVVVWFLRNPPDSGIAAVSVGLLEVAMSAALVTMAAGLLHGRVPIFV